MSVLDTPPPPINNLGNKLFEIGVLDGAIDHMVDDLSEGAHPVVQAVVEEHRAKELAREKERAAAAYRLMYDRMEREVNLLREHRRVVRAQAQKVAELDRAIKEFLKTADSTAYARLVYGPYGEQRFNAEVVLSQPLV